MLSCLGRKTCLSAYIFLEGVSSLLLRQLQHALYRLHGVAGYLGVHLHRGPLVAQRVIYLLQRVLLHILTLRASAASATLRHLRRHGEESLVGTGALHLMEDTSLCSNDKLFDLRMILCVVEHRGRRSLHVGSGQHGRLTLQMGHDDSLGMLLLEFDDLRHTKALMDVTATIPQQHVSARHGVDIASEVVVWSEDEHSPWVFMSARLAPCRGKSFIWRPEPQALLLNPSSNWLWNSANYVKM